MPAAQRISNPDDAVEVDDELRARLRVVADELGARGLPLAVIVRALLIEAALDLEARARARATVSALDD